jgi:hypothetical protein
MGETCSTHSYYNSNQNFKWESKKERPFGRTRYRWETTERRILSSQDAKTWMYLSDSGQGSAAGCSEHCAES